MDLVDGEHSGKETSAATINPQCSRDVQIEHARDLIYHSVMWLRAGLRELMSSESFIQWLRRMVLICAGLNSGGLGISTVCYLLALATCVPQLIR